MRFNSRLPIVALHALLISCGSGSHHSESPAVIPAPAAQPLAPPPSPNMPNPKVAPKTAPHDSGGPGTYPWQSAPIAAL
jgi:hypothetical protein